MLLENICMRELVMIMNFGKTLAGRMMARNCGKPDDYFVNLIHDKGHADWYLDAGEAKEHNITQHLRVPSLKGKVTVSFDLE